MRISVLLSVVVAAVASGCNPMYAPCERQIDCAQGLRCVDLNGTGGAICTQPCTISRSRSGLPDAIDDAAFYEDGTVQDTTVSSENADCLEGGASVQVENGNFNVAPENEGDAIGVCRVSDEQVASGQIGGSSTLTGWCAPL